MSKADYIGVYQSQMSCQSGKQSPPGQTSHAFGDECVHSEPFEQKHEPDFKIIENETSGAIAAVSSDPIDENLQPHLENGTGKIFTQHLEQPPKDVHLSQCLCYRKDTLEQKLESSCIAGEHFGRPSEYVTYSHSSPMEHLRPPTEDPIKGHSIDQLGPPGEDVAKNYGREQLESPSDNGAKNSSRLGLTDRRTSKLLKNKYILRSTGNSDRVLRTRSKDKPKAPESSKNLANVCSGVEENRKKKRKKKGVNRKVADEYLRLRAQVRYFLNRISYEQSLIAAYSGEGWKGLSLEKLKPEKELQRATSEILRRKLKIRDLFQHLESLCAEGRFAESLFDSEGQIDSEDIFCAKCGSKDLSTDNDIILCDGACDRGFHQFCLEPPLFKEDIPLDDDGWLCPGCDCKLDCIELLNESQGTNLSITDKWEKVFPEAAAGQSRNPNFGHSSEDSDDNDYDPEVLQSDGKDQGDESSSDDSEFTSASDDLGTLPNDEQHLGPPSDESEDDNYDPDAPDLDNNVNQESSSSDFTSDSEDLGTALDDNISSAKHKCLMPLSSLKDFNKQRSRRGGKKKQFLDSDLLSILELDPGQDGSAPFPGRRNVERLDYKKLHDEEYGNCSSHSSEDEDWTDTVAPRRRQKRNLEVAPELPKGNSLVNKRATKTEDVQKNLEETESTPMRRSRRKSNNEDAKLVKSHEGYANSGFTGKKSANRRLGEDVTQRLLKSFKENQYPDRTMKENLAKELHITFRQVNKWFGNARWSFNHPPCMDAKTAGSSSKKRTPLIVTKAKPLERGPETCTRDSTYNGAKIDYAPEEDAAVTKHGSADSRDSESVIHERGSQISTTPMSAKRKRKGKMDRQASDL
ncbi:Homeobox domain-containing protein/PHD domain-containing protein [Cephalotus follicularis]|uniref:Homeobox domain-containing protein/PHD domain-containing protein n=1 Tax=Cephalotus follicularis TaxID=3775 RepID=A0A1Q3D2E2_CEPFO|nr:Homeobox domain-containing protein/PHD domain-containing protein [Cephalotus follicularis]